MRSREFTGALGRSLDQLVHASAADAGEAHKHASFIAAHLMSGLAAFALIPLCLVADSAVAAFSVTALAILGLETLVALYVSRTGRLADGHLLSAATLTLLVTFISGRTGGLTSFAIVWFAVAPIEAALSGQRRIIAAAGLIGAAGVAAVALLSLLGIAGPPIAFPGGSALLNTVAGLLGLGYALGVAVGIERRERLAEQALEARERRYRLLADTMADVVTCHRGNGDVTFASPAAERLLLARPADLVADGLFRRVHVADRPAYLTALSAALHKGEAKAEFRLRRGEEGDVDGWVWVEAQMRRPADNRDAESAIICVTRDITVRKCHELELEALHTEAAAASCAKTRFLASMSHELRTPLNAIIGFSDILTQELFGRFEYDRHREYSRLIKESGEHLLQVVNDILDMSKIDSGAFHVTPEPFDCGALVERCRLLMEPQARKAEVELVSAVDAGLPELTADPRACRQILLNLLSNAIKFSHKGGRVSCGARRNGDTLDLIVRDTGIGIAAEDIARLGTPFVQAQTGYDRQHEGTGLGLSVVKGLAGLHGGRLTIESDLGKGTTVTVTLPLKPLREPVTPLPRVEAPLPRAEAPGADTRHVRRA